MIKLQLKIIPKKYIKNLKKRSLTTNINKSHITNFKQSILYENDNFLIIDKWSGIAAQGGSNITISIDAIIKNISENYNLVHRLDKETSGLMIIAKNLAIHKVFW